MTSSMLSGERRWATSTRRGGKTVLGKVAVPKPINLPSQRLENHGLDPSVEIVPKGTHSWGSRPSSSTSNAWGTVSPGTEGGTGSPSHLSGRPSSGGSNTRPSTSSSDRAHEPNANAWGPNSRPSSASGALTSNQTLLTSLRPRSAETRPGSSQLSRFAEPLPENTGAWGAAGTPEILGAMASKNDGFSLSSGDFPTLGSEKDNSGRNIDSQDHSSHGRPVSSSGGVALPKEGNGASIVGDVSVDANVKSGNANSWRRDKCEDAVPSGVEKWQTDPQPYPNPSIPHHFEAWHGPPVTNPPGGVWFRGPPGGHPYGPPVGPGAFPMEPFPYYRPQMPATTLANPQPGPPPGGGPRGHHPNNGDLYRPHMTDAYIRPGMPIRPGFYPGPVAYEGYYGGPMGYCNSNDRDVPFMGMASGPPVYNRYSTQNAPEPSSSQGRSGGYGSAGKTMVPEHMESGRPHDTRGPYKVLLKQQNGWDGRNKERKWEGTISTDAAYIEKADQPGMSSWENDWRSDYRNDVEISLRQMTPSQEISSQTCDDRRSSVPVKVNSPKSVGNMKVSDDIPASNLECASSGSPEIPGSVSAVPKDSTLIKKIEGLNAKARAADGQHNIASVSSWEGQKKKFSVHNAKASHPADEGGRGFVYAERIHATGITNPASRETGVSVGDKSLESMAAGGTTISRSIHDMQGRGGNHGKGGHNGLEVDGWRKKAQVMETSVVSASRSDTNSTVFVHDHHTSFEASKKSLQFPRAREERESAPPVFDPSDNQAQHTKLRELEQRAKQLREEEEERTRKQMAKAPVFDPSDNQAQHTKLRELEQRAKQLREEEEERTRKQMAKARAKLEDLDSQPAGSAVGKVGLAFESRNRDGRQNKQGRAHGSWRQRGSTELVGVQSLQDGPSYPGQNVQNPVKDYQTQKLDVGLVKEQQTYSDEWNAPDGGNIPDNSDSVAHVAVTAITDQGVTGRAKRLPLKGHKGMGNNNGLDQKECSSGDADKIDTQSSSLEMSHIHLPTTSKDNRGTGERSTAHWQPKSQTFPANSQGSRTNSVRSGGPGVVWTNKKESTPQGATVPLTPLHDKRTGEGVSPPCHDQFPSKKVDAEEALGAGGHREAKRGKKVGSLKGRPHSPNLVPVSPVEQAPGSMDVRQEQRSSSGFRKSGNQNNNRFSRLHESRGDWNSSGHDSKHNNPSSNWDRQRPNSHYEYQPVGPDNNNKSNIAEGPKDGIPNTGPRFRERGQNHSRHGGGRFYGRQGGTDRVDADYE
ncbi:hypothetical protein I3842_11G023500 [Carya illinoinensis]|uniref:BAT2 N-terminal domain-containing protein n=1 Tax=Carya illinoinensis TaxID=32201 RepID=A0A922DLA0_CARIL|nr:hypothetical protein I3842_11G023500 [Carya illinoinensis]